MFNLSASLFAYFFFCLGQGRVSSQLSVFVCLLLLSLSLFVFLLILCLCLFVLAVSMFVCLFIRRLILIKGGRRLCLCTCSLLPARLQDLPLYRGEKVDFFVGRPSLKAIHQSDLTQPPTFDPPAARRGRTGRAGSCGRGRKTAPLPGKPSGR